MEFTSIEVDSMSRGTGPVVALEFIEAIEQQLGLPAYAQSGFSIDAGELKSCIGYTGSAKLNSLVWSINMQLERSGKKIRAGVRSKGTRIAFFAWNGKKRRMQKADETEAESA